MFNRTAAAVTAQQWQRQLDESVEAGEALWLELGVSNRVVDTLQALTALDLLSMRRTDVTTPGVFVGGDGVVWTATCLHPAVATLDRSAPGVLPLYGGADRATYMATLATVSGPSAHAQQGRVTGLPVGMHSWLQPITQPGVAPLWSALPFVLGAPTQATSVNGEVTNGAPWLSWVTLLVVIGLIITALFV